MIEVENLNYYIDNKIILKDINFKINRGDFTSIIGPNGAGKSTLLKVILGLINSYKGTIRIDGEPHKSWLKKNIIGYVPQKEQFANDFPATVTDIVLMGLAGRKGLFRGFSAADKKHAIRVMEEVEIDRFKDSYIGTLSGGEFQRVLLARAIICDAAYIFLDEPETSVDRRGVAHFYELLARINREGRTILIVSHDVNTTVEFASTIICLNKTLHCHDKPELLNSEIIKKTYGDVIRLIERKEQ